MHTIDLLFPKHRRERGMQINVEELAAQTARQYLAVHGSPIKKPVRYDELRDSPKNAPVSICVIEFNVPGKKNGGTDKGPNGHRIDSIPIANGVIKAGGACQIVKYFHDQHDQFTQAIDSFDGFIVRINP